MIIENYYISKLARKLALLAWILFAGYALWYAIAVVYSPAVRESYLFFWILCVCGTFAVVAYLISKMTRKLARVVWILYVGYALWYVIAVVYSPAVRENDLFSWILYVFGTVATMASFILWGNKKTPDLTELKISAKRDTLEENSTHILTL